VTAVAIGAGCTSEVSPLANEQTATKSNKATASAACEGKACGVDCSPAGSDEPFSCTAAGACVSTPVENDCKKCPEFLGDCIKGQSPADADGDGCIDSCK